MNNKGFSPIAIKFFLFIMTFIVIPSAYAETPDSDLNEDLEIIERDFNVQLDGQFASDTYFNELPATGSSLSLSESFVSLSVSYQEKIRAVISANLAQVINPEYFSFVNEIDIQRFIREAYIEIREINDVPVAIVIGKQPIIFGQNVQEMPSYALGPLRQLQEIREVYGLTITLTESLLGLFDQIDYSLYEQGSGDMVLGKLNGHNLRLTKYLNEQILLTIGLQRETISEEEDNHSHQARIGIIAKDNTGRLVGWAEGIIFSNDPDYPNSNFALTLGASYEYIPRNHLVVEFNLIEKELVQLGFGIKTQINGSFNTGLDFRVSRNLQTNETEYFLGLNLTYYFNLGTNNYKIEELDIFDEEGLE